MPDYNHAFWLNFLEDIEQAAQDLGSPSTVWYRGHNHIDYELLPALFRKKIYSNGAECERSLFDTFAQWIPPESWGSGAAQNNDWDILFQMQHYGVPTRLLDWSETFAVAVFFATLGSVDQDCALFVLDPNSLNAMQNRKELLSNWSNSQMSYRKMYWDGDPITPTLPLAMHPDHRISRVRAQTGRFTIHGSDLSPLEMLAPASVRKVTLDQRALPYARNFLKLAGVTPYSVFPDVTGAAMLIPEIAGLK